MEERPDTVSGTPERAFAADPQAVYAFLDRFFGSLVAAGVEHVVISPGSRSTQLALCAVHAPGLRSWIQIDERSAAFFALGLAKASRRAVALICTSGTAAANYLPAVVEAHHARTPLLVLTADRPPELRDWGAGQTIDQLGLYGRHVRWMVEVPVAMRGEEALRYASRLAARAVDEAGGASVCARAGPVHLNWPLREPLEPPMEWAPPAARTERTATAAGATTTAEEGADPGLRFSHAMPAARPEDVRALLDRVRSCERGVVSVGPIDAGADPVWAEAVVAFSRASGWPLLADPASSLRSGESAVGVLTMGDAFTRAPGFAGRMRPDFVLRIGDMPVSKAQRLWLEAAAPKEVWWLDEGGQWGEASRQATRVVRGGAQALLTAVARALSDPIRPASRWSRSFEKAEAVARQAFDRSLDDGPGGDPGPSGLSGLAVARRVVASLPPRGRLFASNSMSIRLLDLAFAPRSEAIQVFANRGASGIDGITSTALGVAAAAAHADKGARSVLLTGDLAFLHDLGGLWLAARERLDLTIVVLDDDGGGIFSYLPIARQGEKVQFDRLFTTPHGLDLARAAALFDLECARIESDDALADALDRSFQTSGVSILHVRLDPQQNEAAFRACLARVIEAVDGGAPEVDGTGAGSAAAGVRTKTGSKR